MLKNQARRIRTILLILLAFSYLLLPTAASAKKQAQSSEDFDRPLLSANLCGGGASDDVHFTFAATGDTFPHENVQEAGEAQGYDYLFERVQPFLKAADIGYTNFDGAMLANSPRSGYPLFNFSPKLATALKNAGISLVSTANNHILDRSYKGLDATLEVLQQNGIMQHGTVPSENTQNRPPYQLVTLTRNGVSIKIGFLSFSWGTNGNPDYYNQVNLLYQSNDYGQQGKIRQSVLDDIAKARRETDFVIVAAHFGFEYQFYPHATQLEAATKMAEAGADVILGAQPHTLQPVDIIETNGRKTLIMYSLANFLANQSVYQAKYFSNTSIIFYVGIIRQADGKVRVSGYRYLPTMIVDGDTRPAPVPLQGFSTLHEHVRQKMRDVSGVFQVNPDPAALGNRIEVCPSYSFSAAPGKSIGGDFAQYFATLGSGTTPRPPQESIALIGYPINSVVQEATGDCQRTTSVLYTERQRLELQEGADWPFRVVGTQIGTEIYRAKYKVAEIQRRTNLEADAIINDRFKTFYDSYGGLTVFGYPISGELTETDPTTRQSKTVQYFERARFELPQNNTQEANPLYQVQLGLLGKEYPGIASQCNLPATARNSVAPKIEDNEWWFWPVIYFGTSLMLGMIVFIMLKTRRPVYQKSGVRGQESE